MTNPIDAAFPASGNGSRGEVVDLLKGRMPFVLTSATEAAGLELSGHRWLLVGTQRDFFELDASATGPANGTSLITDASGNLFARRSGVAVTSLFNHYGSGAPSSGLGSDGQTYFNVANGDVYLKAAGSWGAAVGNLKGATGDISSDNSVSDMRAMSQAAYDAIGVKDPTTIYFIV